MAKLTAIQLSSVPSVNENLQFIEMQLRLLPYEKDHLVVLPECCLFYGGQENEQLTLAQQSQAQHLLVNALAQLAIKYRVYLLAGTIPLLNASGDKFYNASCLFDPDGHLLQRYNKIHLFDVDVADNHKNYRESRYTQAGHELITADLPFAKLGLTVCYDLRFPGLFASLRQLGADIITLPSAFTKVTGAAHWQALVQARAIETQCYIIAPNQWGKHANGRETWGHSMIVSPWGEILASKAKGIGAISVEYQPQEISRIRQAMPVFEHNQFTVELKHS